MVFPDPGVVVAAALNLVFMEKAHVEPHRAVEGTVLVQQQPFQVIFVGRSRLLGSKVPFGEASVDDGVGHPVDQVGHRIFVAPVIGDPRLPEVLGSDDVGSQLAPTLGHLHLFHLKNRPPFGTADLRVPFLPFHGRPNVLRLVAGHKEKGLEVKAFFVEVFVLLVHLESLGLGFDATGDSKWNKPLNQLDNQSALGRWTKSMDQPFHFEQIFFG